MTFIFRIVQSTKSEMQVTWFLLLFTCDEEQQQEEEEEER